MKYRIVLLAFAAFLFSRCQSKKQESEKVTNQEKAAQYKMVEVRASGLSSTVKLPGQLAAYQEVSIFPKVNGYVRIVNVDIGSKVKKGQLLMTLEAPELEQSTVQARERFVRTKADLSIDKEHFYRLLEASETPGAISPLELSAAKAKMEADSAASNAAKIYWEMQETMQAYLKVVAPFNGVITERNVHPGALVSAQAKDVKPMLELKDIAHLRLKVDIPENLIGNMKEGDTISFFTSALPGKKMTGFVSRKSMNINAQFRVEGVEADIMNKDGRLAPGMYADIIIYPKGDAIGFSVPKSSVVTSTERKYVLVLRSGKISKVDVNAATEFGDFVEVFADLIKGDSVITDANDEIAEGKYPN